MRYLKLFSYSCAVFGIALCGLLIGCGRNSPAPSAQSHILVEPLYSEPASFDPRVQVDSDTYNIMYEVYDTLVELDNNMQVVPALAERWETKDYKTWRFSVRKGTWFHENPCFKNAEHTRTVTAQDVAYSLNRALKPGGVGAFALTDVVQGAKDVNDGKAETATGIRVVDEQTLEIELVKPYRNLAYKLATPFLFVIPREAVESYGESFGRNPVGTGPFSLGQVIPGKLIRLTRNPRYWGKGTNGTSLPYLDGVDYRILASPEVAWSQFKLGALDSIEIPAILAQSIAPTGKLLPEYARFVLLETDALDVHYFGFRMDKPPFKDNLTLREALNYAVDKRSICDHLLNGLARPAAGVLPPSVYPEFKRPAVFEYNLDLAKTKLAAAGYPNGNGLPEITLAIDNKPTTEVVAQFVQDALTKLGVRIKLRRTEFSTLLTDVSEGKADFFYMYWEGTDPNAEIFMVQFKSDQFPDKGGYNFGRYSNPQADQLYDQAVAELNPDAAIKTWLKMNEVVSADAPWLFLYHSNRLRLTQANIKDYDHNPMQIRRFVSTKKL